MATRKEKAKGYDTLMRWSEPHILSSTTDPPPISDIQKYSRDLCFALYLLLRSVAKFVGKMLATLLRLLRQNN